MAEPDKAVHISQRICSDELVVMITAAAAAMKIFFILEELVLLGLLMVQGDKSFTTFPGLFSSIGGSRSGQSSSRDPNPGSSAASLSSLRRQSPQLSGSCSRELIRRRRL
jgi:hypothetical protein